MSIVNIEALKQNGAVLWWPGQYASSGTTHGFPILPAGVTVTPNGTFTSIKAKDGRNYYVFGGTNEYIGLGNKDAFDFSNKDFTICCWSNVSGLSQTSAIFGNSDISASAASRTLSIGINATTGYFIVYLWDTSSNQINVLSTYACSINTWYFLSAIRSGNVVSLYVNCSLVYSVAVTGTLQFPATTYSIGAIGTYTGARMMGNIKDLMIFKGKALSIDQINAIMAETYIY